MRHHPDNFRPMKTFAKRGVQSMCTLLETLDLIFIIAIQPILDFAI